MTTAGSDTLLVEHARSGSAASLEALYVRHADRLFTIARRLTGSSADAEDALHDLFVGLPELLRRYEERGRLDQWLTGVLVRLVLTRSRTTRRQEAIAAREAVIDRELQQPVGDPWTTVDLERALAALPDALRGVFVLRQIEGYTHDDIAALLGISSAASRVRYFRALRQLRLLLEPGS